MSTSTTPRRSTRRRRVDSEGKESLDNLDKKEKKEQTIEKVNIETSLRKKSTTTTTQKSSCCFKIFKFFAFIVKFTFYILIFASLAFCVLQAATQVEELEILRQNSGEKIENLIYQISELKKEVFVHENELREEKARAKDIVKNEIFQLEEKFKEYSVKAISKVERAIEFEQIQMKEIIDQIVSYDIKTLKNEMERKFELVKGLLDGFTSDIQGIQDNLSNNIKNLQSNVDESTVNVDILMKHIKNNDKKEEESYVTVKEVDEKVQDTEVYVSKSLDDLNKRLDNMKDTVEDLTRTANDILNDVVILKDEKKMYEKLDEYLFDESNGAMKKLNSIFKNK